AKRLLSSTEFVLLEFFPEALRRSGCPSPASLLEALPGFSHAYAVTFNWSSGSRRKVMRLVPVPHTHGYLSARTWLWEDGSFWSTKLQNLLFTRRPLPVTEREQALHLGQIVRVVVEATTTGNDNDKPQ
ncbi:unnamed protein product, partial [Polarella glacialis]